MERKSDDMKKQKKKQEKLIMKMLPKAIIEKVMEGGATTVADTFDNATLYFSAVDGFIEVSRHCRYRNILNNNILNIINKKKCLDFISIVSF